MKLDAWNARVFLRVRNNKGRMLKIKWQRLLILYSWRLIEVQGNGCLKIKKQN